MMYCHVTATQVYYLYRRPIHAQSTMPTWVGAFRLLRLICLRERITLVHCHQAFSTLGGEALLQARTMGYKVRQLLQLWASWWILSGLVSACVRRGYGTLMGVDESRASEGLAVAVAVVNTDQLLLGCAGAPFIPTNSHVCTRQGILAAAAAAAAGGVH
jgi:hypothetical protein